MKSETNGDTETGIFCKFYEMVQERVDLHVV